MKTKKWLTAFSLVVGGVVHAENSLPATLWNQLSHGNFCGTVTEKEKELASCSCQGSAPRPLDILKSAQDTLEWNIFQQAAKKQVQKNACIYQQLSVLARDQGTFNTWSTMLATTWLSTKKADLMQSVCDLESSLKNKNPYVRVRMVADLRSKKDWRAGVITNSGMNEHWKKICEDRIALEKIRLSKSMFRFALPVVSTPEIFRVMEENRQVLINKKTGKPITDGEIAAADLSDLSFLELKLGLRHAFRNQLLAEFDRLSNERTDRLAELRSAFDKTTGAYELDTRLKDYLFQDLTVTDVMRDQGLMSLDSGDPSKAAACMIAKYEPSLGGALADFVVMSYGLGSVALLLKGGAQAKGVDHFWTSFRAGLRPSVYKDAGLGFYNACFPGNADLRQTTNLANSDIGLSTMGASLPGEFGWESWNLSFDEKDTPACKAYGSANFAMPAPDKHKCEKEFAIWLTPMHIALPLSLAM